MLTKRSIRPNYPVSSLKMNDNFLEMIYALYSILGTEDFDGSITTGESEKIMNEINEMMDEYNNPEVFKDIDHIWV